MGEQKENMDFEIRTNLQAMYPSSRRLENLDVRTTSRNNIYQDNKGIYKIPLVQTIQLGLWYWKVMKWRKIRGGCVIPDHTPEELKDLKLQSMREDQEYIACIAFSGGAFVAMMNLHTIFFVAAHFRRPIIGCQLCHDCSIESCQVHVKEGSRLFNSDQKSCCAVVCSGLTILCCDHNPPCKPKKFVLVCKNPSILC